MCLFTVAGCRGNCANKRNASVPTQRILK
uniref:Uncharacterized protein n=1 Tax=Arundo donax TaxID=35708 RepID=A0A0A9HDG8_ARUDO